MKGQGKHLVILPWKLSWLQLQFSLGEMQVFNTLAWIFQRDLSLTEAEGYTCPTEQTSHQLQTIQPCSGLFVFLSNTGQDTGNFRWGHSD